MEKKAKLDKGAFFIIGLIYAVLGSIFLALGIILAIVVSDDARLIGLIFGGIGSLFFVLGIVFLGITWNKKRRASKLLQSGRYIWGEIAEYRFNYNVYVGNRSPVILLVRYVDPYGTTHIFKSGNVYLSFCESLVGQKVKVYVEENNFNHYYVDVDGLASNVVEH